MVEANDSWPFQHSAWQLPKLNCMSPSPEPRQLECLPLLTNPGTRMLSANMSMPGSANPGINTGIHMLSADFSMPDSAVPGLSSMRMERRYEADRFPQQLHPYFPTLLPYAGPCLREKQPTFAYGQTSKVTENLMSGSLQKGIVIVDQSGNETRFIYSSVHPPTQLATMPLMKPSSGLNLPGRKPVTMDPPMQTILQERYDENHMGSEESEMHEDTEEINALLYSDEEDDYNYDDDDDEVMSTDHSPPVTKANCQQSEDIENSNEEVASSDGPNKRQKLVNGGYKITPMVNTANSVKSVSSQEYDSDAESSYGIGRNHREEMCSVLDKKCSRKDKIRMTLKILENIIPGAKGKDPSLILDEAIDYLKSLKLKAKALGVHHY